MAVRDSLHGIFASCTRYPRGFTRWAELLGRRHRRRHLEIQVDIQARKLYLEIVPMDLDSDETSRDIDTAVLNRISISWIRAHCHSGLAWRAIFEKCPNIREHVLFSKYACQIFQKQVPKMSFSPCDHW